MRYQVCRESLGVLIHNSCYEPPRRKFKTHCRQLISLHHVELHILWVVSVCVSDLPAAQGDSVVVLEDGKIGVDQMCQWKRETFSVCAEKATPELDDHR